MEENSNKKVRLWYYLYLGGLTSAQRTEVRAWFSKVTLATNEVESEVDLFQSSSSDTYIGWTKRLGDDLGMKKDYYLNAVQSNYETTFTRAGSRRITFDDWSKNYKEALYPVYSLCWDTIRDSEIQSQSLDLSDSRIIKVELVHRHKLRASYCKSSTIAKHIREGSLDHTDGLPLHTENGYEHVLFLAKDCAFYQVPGYSLRGESYRNSLYVDNSYEVPRCFIKPLVNKKNIFKCEVKGKYSSIHNRVRMIAEDGTERWASTYHNRNHPRSERDGIYFANRTAATSYGYARCEYEEDWLPQDEARLKANAEYHSLSRVFVCPETTETTVGFEIEKEDYESIETPYSPLYEKTKWCKESDSSLCDESGFELISPVYPLFTNQLDRDIEKFSDVRYLINSDYSDRCGGHINISSKVYSPIQLLHGMRGFLPLLYSIWSVRISNDYCTPTKISNYGQGRRNSAINLKSRSNILEIRLASAVKSVKNLLWRRDLIRLIIENINRSEMEVLRMLLNKRSKLHKHLRKVYSSDRFVEKCNQFVRYTEEFNDVKLDDIDWSKWEVSNKPSVEENQSETTTGVPVERTSIN